MSVLRLPQPDWLAHRLCVTGPAGDLAAFCRQARGPGVVPWFHDHDRMAEDWFHLLLAAPPHRRSISVAGARILAHQLRDAVWEEHASAAARRIPVALDLHALVPVPAALLRKGADDGASLDWLWRNWGTTWPLRRVEPIADPGGFACLFWSADWTPWPALAEIRRRWPGLTVRVTPDYRV